VQCTASSYQRSYPGVVRHYLGDRAAAAASALIFADGLASCAGGLLGFRSAAAPLLALLTRRTIPIPAAAAHYALVGVAGVLALPLLCARRVSSLRRPAQVRGVGVGLGSGLANPKPNVTVGGPLLH